MNIKTIGAALALGAVVAGCSKEEEPVEAPKAEQTEKADAVVLAVAGEKLMRSQLDADVDALIKAQGDKIPAEQLEYARQMFRSQLAQGFLVQRALLAKAKAAGYVVTDAERTKRSEEVMRLLAKQPDAPKTIDEYFAKFPLGAKRAREEFDAGLLIDKLIKDEQLKAPAVDYQAKAEEIVANVVSNNLKAAGAEAEAEAASQIALRHRMIRLCGLSEPFRRGGVILAFIGGKALLIPGLRVFRRLRRRRGFRGGGRRGRSRRQRSLACGSRRLRICGHIAAAAGAEAKAQRRGQQDRQDSFHVGTPLK